MSEGDKTPARQLLLRLSRSDLMAMYVLAEVTSIMKAYPDEDDADDMMNKVNQRLHQLKYSTSWEAALSEYEAALKDERGMWAGRYALFDEAGEAYDLTIEDDAVSLAAGDALLTEHSFANGVLKVWGSSQQFELTLHAPLTEEQLGDPRYAVGLPTTPTMPRCSGTVTLSLDGQSQTRQVHGKRGCFSKAGVEREQDGDPVVEWAGLYQLVYTDKQPFEPVPQGLRFETAGEGVKVLFGEQTASDVHYRSNVLQCVVDAASKTQLVGYFVRTPGTHLRRFFGLIDEAGKARSVTGYWTAPSPVVKALPPAHPRVRANAALAEDPMSNDPPKGARTVKIDLAGLVKSEIKGKDKDNNETVIERNWTTPNELLLPGGVERNSYWIILDFAGTPSGLTGTLSKGGWQFGDKDALTQTYMHLLHGADGQPWLDGDFGETESAGWYHFSVTQQIPATDSTPKQTVTVPFTMQAMSRFPIVITPDELPPFVIDVDQDVGVTANGGEAALSSGDTPELLWSYSGTLPEGITCNVALEPSTPSASFTPSQFEPRLKGKVTKGELALKTFPLRFVARSSNRVMMQAGRQTINLRVEPAISSADSKMITASWFSGFGAAAVSVALGGVGIGLAYLWKHHKANNKYEAAKHAIAQANTQQIPSKEHLYQQVVAAYNAKTNAYAAFDDAVTRIDQLVADVNTAIRERAVKREAILHALQAEGLSEKKRRELDGELEKVKEEIREAESRRRNAERIKDHLNSSERESKRGNRDFEKHIRK